MTRDEERQQIDRLKSYILRKDISSEEKLEKARELLGLNREWVEKRRLAREHSRSLMNEFNGNLNLLTAKLASLTENINNLSDLVRKRLN